MAEDNAPTGEEGSDTADAGTPEPILAPPEGDDAARAQAEKDGIDPGPPLEDDDPDAPPGRPDFIPEKFWDAEKGEARLEEIAKAHANAEKQLGKLRREKKGPDVPEKYELKLPEGVAELPEADVEFFKELQLSNEGAQKAVDYIHEKVVPAVTKAYEQAGRTELAANWGMKPDAEEFTARLGALSDWAYRNYPEEIVKHMSSNAGGVDQLWQLMQASDGADLPGGQNSGTKRVTQAELVSMMHDERYIRGDEAYIKQVEDAAAAMNR